MKYCLIIILSILLHIPQSTEANIIRKKILILHSYHQGLKWTDNINIGLQEIFNPLDYKIDLSYEYLNTKKEALKESTNNIHDFFKTKHKNKTYDLIISVDNNALKFIKKHKKEFFSDTPIVFCGINHFTQEMIDGFDIITGVSEKVDFKSTFKIIEDALPKIKNLVIINDDKTTTSKLNLEIIKKLEKQNISRLNFIYYDDIEMPILQEQIANLNKDTAVLLLTFNKDKLGNYYSYQDNYNFIISSCKVPLFISWEFSLKSGVVGGKLISGKKMGMRTAEMAIDILNGKKHIPIENSGFERIVFDYKALQKHNISVHNLPKGSIFINKPANIYQDNKKWIQTILFVLSISISIILILLQSINKRKQAEKALIEEQNKLTTAIKHERLMSSIARILNSTNKISENIDIVLSLLSTKLDIHKISLFRLSPENKISKGIKNRIARKNKNIIFAKDIEHKKALYFFNRLLNNQSIVTTNLSEIPADELIFFEKAHIKSIVALPLSIEKKPIAFISFSSPEKHFWTREEVRLFTLTANMISIVWEQKAQNNKRIEAEKQNLESLRLLEESSRMASVGVMAAGITHEINQPLNSIKINADSILFWNKRNPEILPDIFIKKINTISKESSRIDEIIKHMRRFWEQPKISEDKNISMTISLKQAISLIKRQVFDHSIELIEEIPDKDIFIRANTTQFEQIIINLVVNAIQSLDNCKTKNKKIRIFAYEKNDKGILEIHDNGNGIPEELWDKIYNPLFTTKTNIKGMGLGMAIVKSFVEKFEGNISNYNNEEGGASFILNFKIQKAL